MKKPTVRRPIYKSAPVFVALIVAACQSFSTSPPSEGWLNGRIVDSTGAPIEGQISIGDERIDTDANGTFSFTPEMALVYKMEFRADQHYAMRQTFSHAELIDHSEIGDVVLVERKPGRTLFVFGGDAMIGRRFYTPHDGEPVLVKQGTVLEDSKALLAEMKPYLERADYASINLETPIFDTPPGEAAPKFVTFYSAPQTLDALEWAGVDYVALGNNHTYDFLEPGLDVTLDHLNASALDHSGAGRDETAALQAHRTEQSGATFDMLSYVGWPAGPPTQSADAGKGGAALGTERNLLATTRSSVEAGAIPVLQYHGGLEYVEEPTLSMETKLKQAIDAGAGLVVAHHPHVVQGLEIYNGKLIAWSLGNFLFDQYFYSAQSAALLYVWMDGDEFHHSEAVPIYIKGYHPTPAVGPMRNAINQRLHALSDKRNTHLRRSGGHLVLLSDNIATQNMRPFTVATDCYAGQARTGKDLLARGDFDSYELFGAPDRSWLDLSPNVSIRADEHVPWDHALTAEAAAGETVTTGMRKFQRVFTPGTPMTIRASVSTTADVQIDLYLQTRGTRQSLDDALQNGSKSLIGSTTLRASEATQLDFDFDSPRTGARSIRMLIEVTAKSEAAAVEIDDLQLIEWESPYRPTLKACFTPSSSQ